MQTKLKITGNWSELKTKLQAKYRNLTDSDLTYTSGKEDALVTRLAKKLAKTEEEIMDVIDDLQSKSPKTASKKTWDETESRETTSNEKEKKGSKKI